MKQINIKESLILKLICYTLVPILILMIIFNTAAIMLAAEYEEDGMSVDYFKSQAFSRDYINTINTIQNRLTRNNRIYNIIEDDLIIEEEKTSLESTQAINYEEIQSYIYSNEASKYDILIIKSDGKAYTNVKKTLETDTLDKLKQYISSKPYRWIYTNGEISTDIERLEYKKIAYDSRVTNIEQNKVEIYSCLRDKDSSQIVQEKFLYEKVSKIYQDAPFIVASSALVLLICCSYILISIGHKKGYEGIYTSSLDKIPLEIVLIIWAMLITAEAGLIHVSISEIMPNMLNLSVSITALSVVLLYITCAITVVTIIRRIKAKIFLKNTICYKIIKLANKIVKKLKSELFTNLNVTIKLALIFGGFVTISIILFLLAMQNFIMAMILIAFWYFTFREILKNINKIYEIRNKIKDMYNGDIENYLDEHEYTGELQQVVLELNDISGGLSNAIEQGIKSERLKTELITNVSHDIKTPLTSIINYVDLLKKEEIENEKAQEYLKILDNKSQRLKRLTEDLIEASKASSGNIKLNIEKLNVKELIKQIRAEFEDKFKEKELEIVETMPKEDIHINADSKYMYRVLENMYINIAKYALEKSRVYIDVIKQENKIQIVLKNISKDKLNVTEEELMQRFVRGEESRTTEGSGLGISIAKSLTELQKGKFQLYLDGDLFKVVIELESAN